MSEMQGNPFITTDLTHATQLAEHAVAQATLALAYEQRTANLIAYLEHTEDGQYEVAWNGLQERLGLNHDQPGHL